MKIEILFWGKTKFLKNYRIYTVHEANFCRLQLVCMYRCTIKISSLKSIIILRGILTHSKCWSNWCYPLNLQFIVYRHCNKILMKIEPGQNWQVLCMFRSTKGKTIHQSSVTLSTLLKFLNTKTAPCIIWRVKIHSSTLHGKILDPFYPLPPFYFGPHHQWANLRWVNFTWVLYLNVMQSCLGEWKTV